MKRCCVKLQRGLVLGDRAGKYGLAPVCGKLGRQCVLDFGERASPDLPVLGNRLLLLRRADADLCLQRARIEDRLQQAGARAPHGLSRFLSTNMSLEMSLTDAVSEMLGNRAALASWTP